MVEAIGEPIKLPDGTVKVLVEGIRRASIVRYVDVEECFKVDTVALINLHAEWLDEIVCLGSVNGNAPHEL